MKEIKAFAKVTESKRIARHAEQCFETLAVVWRLDYGQFGSLCKTSDCSRSTIADE
jgi:hypothetical protein